MEKGADSNCLVGSLMLCTFMVSIIIGSCSADYASSNRDNLCNNETNFACVCYKGDGSLSKQFPDCKKFLGSKSLPVVKYSVEIKPNKDVTKYEEYFKPTIIATLIERYCMNGTHECLGTTLPIDYSNVVILKLTYDGRRQSTLYYTVAKPRHPKVLTTNNTMSPEKILSILNLTLDKRPDLIGQAKILEHTSAEITVDGAVKAKDSYYDHFHENIVFFIFLIVLGLIVGVIYVIAIIKVIRDHKRQQEARSKKQENAAGGNNATPNYGAINHSQVRCEIVSGSDHERHTTGTSSIVEHPQHQQERPYYIPPLRVGDIDAYDAYYDDIERCESPQQNNVYVHLLNRFPINKLIKTTSIHNLTSKNRRDPVRKSKSAHHYISEELVALKTVDLNELRQFRESKNAEHPQIETNYYNDVRYKNTPKIQIDEVGANRNFDEEEEEYVYREESNEMPYENENFANFDAFVTNSHEITTNGPIYNDWPTSDTEEKHLKEIQIPCDALHGSLSAAAILTASYTEENLIKSEVSSIADSNSASESDDISEHLNPPASDYQPLRESTWSINQPHQLE